MLGWPRKSRSTSGAAGTWRYWWLCLMNSWNFFTNYVFESEESIFDIVTELPRFGNLENPGQLPVQEVLGGTDDFVLWIFDISSLFMFLRMRNPFMIFLLSYHVSVTSKIQINFRYRRYLKILLIVSYKFLKFSHYLCFRGRGIYFWYSYSDTMFGCLRKFRYNFRYRRYWWFCLTNFWNFFSIYVFEVKESIAGIPTEL